MKITADTNLLVRVLVEDDEAQAQAARAELSAATLVAIPVPVLCELVWVLAQGYRTPAPAIADAIRRLIDSRHVVTDRPASEAGLAQLDAGGDFADGAIAHAGSWLGADVFVSFDKKAVRLLSARGKPARLAS